MKFFLNTGSNGVAQIYCQAKGLFVYCNILLYYIVHASSDVIVSGYLKRSVWVTWLDTGLCLRPGLFSSSSSCLRLKLETPRDLTSPASLQASKACWEEKNYMRSKTDSDYLYRLTEIAETMIKHSEEGKKDLWTQLSCLWHCPWQTVHSVKSDIKEYHRPISNWFLFMEDLKTLQPPKKKIAERATNFMEHTWIKRKCNPI